MLETVVRERIGGATLAEWAAVDIALDALIQLESRVPADLLEDIYPHKPAQALILASQTDDSDDVLTRVLSTAKGHDWFAAANVLLTRRAPALPAALLSSLTLKVTLDLYDREGVGSGRSSGRGGGVGCGGIGLATGLPPWASYSLTSFASPGVTVLAMGPVPVYFKRSVSAPGQTPAPRSVYIDGPTADDRLQYLAGLAGLDRESLPLRGDERHAVVLRSDADLQSRMQLVRADVSQRFARLLRALVAARVMTAEATALYPPHIDLQIEDHRNSR
jgi:hypothetical protein